MGTAYPPQPNRPRGSGIVRVWRTKGWDVVQLSRRAGRQRGFTLVELMVVIAVIAVIAGIALPSFRDLTRRSQLTSAANELSAAIQAAKMESIRTNSKVELCPSTDGSTCAGSNWRRFIVRSVRSGVTTVIRDVTLARGTYTVTGSTNVSANNRIAYLADGFVRAGTATATPQSGALGVCNAAMATENARDVSFSMSRVSVSRAHRAACGAPAN